MTTVSPAGGALGTAAAGASSGAASRGGPFHERQHVALDDSADPVRCRRSASISIRAFGGDSPRQRRDFERGAGRFRLPSPGDRRQRARAGMVAVARVADAVGLMHLTGCLEYCHRPPPEAC